MISAYNKEEALFNYDEVIKSGGKFHLGDIIPNAWYERWFAPVRKGKIIILNKGRCGNGGTTGFIRYAREHCKGLIVSVPNRSIVMSKEDEDKDLCCVYGGVENADSNKNIRICTWDKTNAVEQYNQFGYENIDIDDLLDIPRFWYGSLLVIDEYHKLIDDSNYRVICYKMVEKIINTDCNVVLMSATPNYEFIDFLRTFSGKDVETYNVEYDDEGNDKEIIALQWMERSKGFRLYDIVSEIVNKARNNKKEYELYPSKVGLADNQVVFFFNSVIEITRLVNNMLDTSDVEVLCAKDELHEATVPCYSERFNDEKQIHFMTSAYFTGMDIKHHIDKVVIIGGNGNDFLSYSNKNIKQMLGRFRKGYNGSFVISDGRVIDGLKYADMISKRTVADENLKKYKKFAHNKEYVQNNLGKIIKYSIDYLYYSNIVDNMDGWRDGESFKMMMSIYPEYNIKIHKMPKPKTYKRKRDISFKTYKQKRLDGEKVAYKYRAVCEKFIEKFGLDKFEKATLNDIQRKVKLDAAVGDVDIESMTGEEKFEFLLGDGYYTGIYLMGVLDYLGEKCDYDELEDKMNEVFGCYCIYHKGDKSKMGGCLFLCLLAGDYTVNPQKHGHALIYNKSVSIKKGTNRMNDIKVSKKVSKRDQRTQAITDYLDSTNLYSMIEDGDKYQRDFFTKILADPAVTPNIKRDEEYKKLFDYYKMNQTMISEFYKEVPSFVKYPHKKEEMEKIDCLIVDIDDSISFNEFKNIYSEYEWTAYPTISNTNNDNWTKFRVILPLAHTLSIPNDNMNVLKLLRRMVCKYEDKNHQLGSYINQEQWEMRRVNEGEVVDIGQDTVIYLDALIKNLKTFEGKFRRIKETGGFSTFNYWEINRAITYYQEHDKDGERHKALFVIKNRLSKEDCDVFTDWLWANHPSKMHHWKSHRRISD